MQEKVISSTGNKIHRRYTTKEERFNNVKKWQESGLSVTEYCRQQNIPLTSFIGWKRSIEKPDQIFKQVVTKTAVPAIKQELDKPDKVIEILAEPAVKIRLINVFDALLVVNIAKGLNKCN